MKVFHLFSLLVPLGLWAQGPFAPAAGEPGSTAIHKDSVIIQEWATGCEIMRGYQQLGDTSQGKAAYGSKNDAYGQADNSVVSLGDSGVATLTFAHPITNGPGPDFAVFENGLNANFLELAFVEVSTDGSHFVRFPAVSATQDTQQVGAFDELYPTNLYNLAGKYEVHYGTPFDLQELADSTGIDINNINYVRLVDVIGAIDEPFSSYDSEGNQVNDPYPTVFESGGFDLDAVAVIHSQTTGTKSQSANKEIRIYPTLLNRGPVTIDATSEISIVEVHDMAGRKIMRRNPENNRLQLDLGNSGAGVYIVTVHTREGRRMIKRIVKQ